MEDKILLIGKRVIRTGAILLGLFAVGMLMPSVFVKPLAADETLENLLTSNRASLSLALRQNVVDYLPTDQATMLVQSDNEAGYLLTVEQNNLARTGLFSLTGRLGELQQTNFSLTELALKIANQSFITEQAEEDPSILISVIPVFDRPDKTMFDIEYMQEMTPEICDASPTPVAFLQDGSLNTAVPETHLTDARDGTSYTVRKLADGNCWMSENLRFNLGGRTLTSEDTDIPEIVILTERKEVAEERTITFEDDKVEEEEDDTLGTADNPIRLDGSSADEDVKNLVEESAAERAARAKARAEQELWAEDQTTEEGIAIKKITASEAMQRAGAASILSEKDAREVVTELLGAAKEELTTYAVTGYTFNPTNYTQDVAGARWGSSRPTEEETNTDHSQKGETPEYGNYYNWYAATVGTGTYYMGTKTASATICPKGWTLPHAAGADSFGRLTEIYKLNESTTDLDGLDYRTSDPVSFVLGGNYYYNGLVDGQDGWGDYWTSDVSNLVAANFNVETGEQNYNHKTMGFSVRCVVRQ